MRSSLSQQIQSALIFTSNASTRLTNAENIATSGKRIMKPSDDVPGVERDLSLRTAINSNSQYANNITVSQPLMDETQSALQSLLQVVQNVRTVAATDITAGTEQTQIDKLDGYMSQMVDLANTQYNGQYVFSGTSTDVPAVAANTGATSATQPYTYQGNTGIRQTQVLPWVSLQTNVPGSTVFNFDGSAGAGSTDLFAMVQQLKTAIQSGDKDTISAQLTNIDKNLDNLSSKTAQVGSLDARMADAKSSLTDTADRLKTMLSNTEDADMTSAVVQLKTEENVYQTALSVTSEILNLSLASSKLQ